LLGAILVCQGIGAASGLATVDGLRRWYPTLAKPFFNPPTGIFGPVWTTLYGLMGVAEYLITEQGHRAPALEPAVRHAHRLFALQLGLNAGWSVLFFTVRSPFAALLELVLLWLAIVATIRAFAGISRPAALLVAPYLVWVTFAGVLNASIWWLNRPNRAD
jgi:benzodiazapine receptor